MIIPLENSDHPLVQLTKTKQREMGFVVRRTQYGYVVCNLPNHRAKKDVVEEPTGTRYKSAAAFARRVVEDEKLSVLYAAMSLPNETVYRCAYRIFSNQS